MKKYIKKYTLLLIIVVALVGLINLIVATKFRWFLINSGIELNKANYIANTILFNIQYLTNIIIASVIFSDLLKNKIKGIPVVLLTVLSYFAGVIFFLFLINNKISSNDK